MTGTRPRPKDVVVRCCPGGAGLSRGNIIGGFRERCHVGITCHQKAFMMQTKHALKKSIMLRASGHQSSRTSMDSIPIRSQPYRHRPPATPSSLHPHRTQADYSATIDCWHETRYPRSDAAAPPRGTQHARPLMRGGWDGFQTATATRQRRERKHRAR